MKYDELNKFLEDYVANDKTNRAIMLTGPWGIGKSHFIKHNLTKKLNKKCVSVSLYGMNNIYEVNKGLAFQFRFKHLGENSKFEFVKKHHKKIGAAIGIGKTLFKTFLNYGNLDISLSDKDLNKLCKCFKFENRLIVIEDLERSGIDVNEIMGFINSLVEEDGAKVLIVANEEEIYKNDMISLEKYKNIKEKSISDTIKFKCELDSAIKGILVRFNDNDLTKTAECKKIEEIHKYIKYTHQNLRNLILACQKTIFIFKGISNINIDFYMTVLLNNLKFLTDNKVKIETIEVDAKIDPNVIKESFEDYLHMISHECIINHKVDSKEIKTWMKNYTYQERLKIIRKETYDHIGIITHFYLHSEVEVNNSVRILSEKLDSTDNLDVREYKGLARLLIQTRGLIDNKYIDECKAKMLTNLEKMKMTMKIDKHWSFNPDYTRLDNKDKMDEMNGFNEEMLKIIYGHKIEIPDNLYTTDKLDEFIDIIDSNRDYFIMSKAFISNLKIDLLIQLFRNCNCSQINKLIGCISSHLEWYYGSSQLEIDNINKLYFGVKDLIKSGNVNDRIALWNLNQFLTKIEKMK